MDVVVTGLGLALRGVDGARGLLAPDPPAPDADDPAARLTGRGLRYRDRATRLAMCAARDALAAAGLVRDGALTVPAHRAGVVASTNYGNVDTVCDAVTTIAKETYAGTSPMALPATASNVVASWVAITHGLRGANLTLCNGETSGLDAVHWARQLIAARRVGWVLVVGVEPVNPPVRHLASGGTGADVRLLDGAAALVVEAAESARERGVPGLAEIGPYARKGTWTEAVAAVRGPAAEPVGLWCAPGGAVPPHALEPALTCDLTAKMGECSGALGVLQAAAGTAWLDDETSGVLATAGTGRDGGTDAAAALILRAAR
ncbi:beta-ketoacyl synthase [Actinomadura sp. KC06]|uniref:beta-ketoacyl synthase N-terminal-like domain-containing protein n=1 Tax=Actinomadura sp. KC06 TaxID=2530369 RepID=UPI0010479C75|nr:beta-ketoacyl synthase N-terminal-like domain-containing protein [Actinomadura sp. KC06]TDD40138.1 beta-ketoacyl synthase [Actinomadura sp. KC06]